MPDAQLADEVKEALTKDKANAPIIFLKTGNTGMSLSNILDDYQKREGVIDEGQAIDEVRSREFLMRFQPNSAYCKTAIGNLDIDLIYVAVTVTQRMEPMWLEKVARYSSDKDLISHVADFTCPITNTKLEVVVRKDETLTPTKQT